MLFVASPFTSLDRIATRCVECARVRGEREVERSVAVGLDLLAPRGLGVGGVADCWKLEV